MARGAVESSLYHLMSAEKALLLLAKPFEGCLWVQDPPLHVYAPALITLAFCLPTAVPLYKRFREPIKETSKGYSLVGIILSCLLKKEKETLEIFVKSTPLILKSLKNVTSKLEMRCQHTLCMHSQQQGVV